MKIFAVSLSILCLFSAIAVGQKAESESAKQLESLIKTVSPSIVTIRVVFELEAQGQKQEIRRDILGSVVDKSGLIMVGNQEINPSIPANPRMGPIKITPVDIKIVLGSETKEHDAFLAAKDTKYGLAFVQIKEMKDVTLKSLDFSENADLEWGADVITVGRLGRGYDYAPYLLPARVSGAIKKPRKALITSGELISGLPAFTKDGRVCGVHVPIESGDDDAMSPQGRAPIFLIATKIVGAKIKQSLVQAAERLADLKKKPEAEAPKKEGEDAKKAEGAEKKEGAEKSQGGNN